MDALPLIHCVRPGRQAGESVATSSARAGIKRKAGEPHLPQAGNPAELAEGRDYIRWNPNREFDLLVPPPSAWVGVNSLRQRHPACQCLV